MTEEMQQELLERLNKLGTGERAALRREAGSMIQNADGAALRAFYRCVPDSISFYDEAVCFAVACLRCLWDPCEEKEYGEPIEKIIAQLVKKEELSESTKHRVQVLIDTRWDDDGYMLSKVVRLVKLIRQKSDRTMIDFSALMKDLSCWNMDSQWVQRKWAKAIFGYQRENVEGTEKKK